MSSRRTLILIAAIAVGAIAAFALYNYVQGIEDRAYEEAERVEVFKVDRNIPQGFPGAEAVEERYIVRSEIPREFLPANAVNDPDQIVGLVALNELSANQVLVDGMFVDPSVALISFAERIDPEEATVTISVDQVGGVAGLLVPGDKVNMLVSAGLHEYPEDQLPPVGTGPGTPNSPGLEFIEIPYDSHARYLYQAVEILAIGQSPVPQPGETVDAAEVAGQSGLITFAVPPEAVQRIVAASGIYLSLVNPEYEPQVLPMPDPYEVLPGEDPARLTPYGPGGRE
ncbi:MAG: Flp pilus assembly protein CpaB [Acidimicrobiales bacterium]|nr:Flp pilus assembly protein CpaB [Acidimicrobiales bacterium]